jgi:hypothetical protein
MHVASQLTTQPVHHASILTCLQVGAGLKRQALTEADGDTKRVCRCTLSARETIQAYNTDTYLSARETLIRACTPGLRNEYLFKCISNKKQTHVTRSSNRWSGRAHNHALLQLVMYVHTAQNTTPLVPECGRKNNHL